MPHVRPLIIQQQHFDQLQRQQQHATLSSCSNPPAIYSEQPEAVTSPSSVPSLSSQEETSATLEQQQLQPNQPQHSHQQLSSQYSEIENISQLQAAAPAASEDQHVERRKVSCRDIQLVQNLIERCLQLYMNQGEVVNTLLNQAQVEPGFTSLVWQKLEEQNHDFFIAYYTRLKLKKHIILFNHLLEQQVELLKKMRMLPTKSASYSPVSKHPTTQSVVLGFPMPHHLAVTNPGFIHAPPMCASPQSPSSHHGELQTQESFQLPHEIPGQSGIMEMMEAPSALPSSGSGLNPDLQSGSSSGIPTDAAFSFCAILNSPPEASFCPQDPHAHNATSIALDSDIGDENSSRDLLGALTHLPRSFSLSDLTAELGTHSSMIMDPHFSFFEKL